MEKQTDLKDGAYVCYCAFVTAHLFYASRYTYSGFLWVRPTNAGIFLRGFDLCGESRTEQVLLLSKKKITKHFSEIIKLQF